MAVHPSAKQLQKYALHQLGPQRMRVVRHLEECENCRRSLKDQQLIAKRTSSMKRLALSHLFGEE